MGNCTQKMRCGNCRHTAEMDVAARTDVSAIKNWYKETAKNMRWCPNCHVQKYALSAYDNNGLRELRSKGASNIGESNMRGAWYCTISGNLQRF